MTTEQIQLLTPEEKNVRIAEACGWRRNKTSVREQLHWWRAGNSHSRLPDYLHDLNAMHEAETPMHDSESSAKWNEYVRALNRICAAAGDEDTHATAAQRADAFLLCQP